MFKIGEKVIFVGIFGEEKEAEILYVYGCNGHNMYEIETTDKQRYNVSQSCLKKLNRLDLIFNVEVERIEEALKEREEMKNKKMKTWEAIKALEEGKKVRHSKWHETEYIYMDENKNIIEKGNFEFVFTRFNSSGGWEIYEETKNKCEDCAYRFKLQTGDIMCCKYARDTKDDMHCKEFEYNEPSDDYVKAINALVKAIKESE